MTALAIPGAVPSVRSPSGRSFHLHVAEIVASLGGMRSLATASRAGNSPWSVRRRAFQAGRVPAGSRRHRWLHPGFRVNDEVWVAHRVVGYGEFEDPVEDTSSTAGSTAVEAKHELVDVARQVGLIHRSLVSAEQPPLGERCNPVNSREQRRRVCPGDNEAIVVVAPRSRLPVWLPPGRESERPNGSAWWPGSLHRGFRHPARATAISRRAWGLLLGAPALTETGLAPAGNEQREADTPASASSRRTRGRSYPRPCRKTAGLQVGPPFKPCVRISRTRLPSGRSSRRITRPPDTESSRAGGPGQGPRRRDAASGRPGRDPAAHLHADEAGAVTEPRRTQHWGHLHTFFKSVPTAVTEARSLLSFVHEGAADVPPGRQVVVTKERLDYPRGCHAVDSDRRVDGPCSVGLLF